MSSEISVKVSGLSKRYGLYDKPWQNLTARLFRREPDKFIWALRNVSFEAKLGDFVGVIGRNGAGKSTLLQILAGTVAPSEGTCEINGKVAAMLELGAGFNPDFTGRENAELSASIYGLSLKQNSDKLPLIEEFAGIGEFFDRPVREYSSGMYARLAFAVAAHVDADILIIDEILGVGDIRFQQKSMRLLREYKKDCIVFFVSHSEASILSVCNRALWLDQGSVRSRGEPKKVVQSYLRGLSKLSAGIGEFRQTVSDTQQEMEADNSGSGEPSFEHKPEHMGFDFEKLSERVSPGSIQQISVLCDGDKATTLKGGELLELKIECKPVADRETFVAFAVRDKLGQVLFGQDSRIGLGNRPKSWRSASFGFELPYLPTGEYTIDVALVTTESEIFECVDLLEAAATFSVLSKHISQGMANQAMIETRLTAQAVAPQ